MARRYRGSFEIFETEEEARAFCGRKNAEATRYAREHHPAHYTEWAAPAKRRGEDSERGFIAWYVC